MKRAHVLRVILALVVGGLACAAAQRGNQLLVFRKHVLMDPDGFQMEVLRLLAPKDWQFQGSVTWNYRIIPPTPTTVYTVSSSDGRSVAEQFPPDNFYWTEDTFLRQSLASSGLPVRRTMSAAQYLKEIWAPHYRAGVSGMTVLEAQSLPEVATQLRRSSEQQMNIFGQISPFQFPYEMRADAARVKFQYQRDGQTVVEEATAAISYFISSLAGMYGPIQETGWTPTAFSFYAPAQEMNQKVRLFEVITRSRQDNPAWSLNCTRLSATVTRDQIRQQNAIFARMQEIHRTQEQTSDMIVNSYRERSATYDRIFEKYDQTIRGVETYVDPGTNTHIELPYGYNDAWTNGTDYVLSSDPSYNPNVGSTQSWKRLERPQQ